MAKSKKELYELLAGTHNGEGFPSDRWSRDPNGPPVYVEDHRPLDQMFPGKFKRVVTAQATPAQPKATKPTRDDTLVAIGSQKNAAGIGSLPAETPAEADLTEPGEGGESEGGDDTGTSNPVPGKGTKADAAAQPDASEDDGDEVSEEFPKAQDNDLKVFKHPEKHYVVKDGTKVLAEDLRTKPAVRSFLTKHLNEAHDEPEEE